SYRKPPIRNEKATAYLSYPSLPVVEDVVGDRVRAYLPYPDLYVDIRLYQDRDSELGPKEICKRVRAWRRRRRATGPWDASAEEKED
ncbi:hypothetical protein V5O48_016715, partial [Marasmius crinis-equi]